MAKRKITRATKTAESNTTEASPEKKTKTEVKSVEETVPEATTQEDLENTVDNIEDIQNTQDNEAEDLVEEDAEKTELSLDSLGRAHPYALMKELAKHQNKIVGSLQIEEKTEDGKKFSSMEYHFGTMCITIPKVENDNRKFLMKIATDLALKKFYPEAHELDLETEKIIEGTEVEYSTDEDWKHPRQEKFDAALKKMVDSKIANAKKEDGISEEELNSRIARYESLKVPNDEVPEYDEIYKPYDNPYFTVFNNVVIRKRKELSYDCKIFKIIGDTETQIAFSKRVNDKAEENEKLEVLEGSHKEYLEGVKFKIALKIFKKDEPEEPIISIEHTDDSGSLYEAKSEAAYQMLEKMLEKNLIERLHRGLLQNDRNRERGRPSFYFRNGRKIYRNHSRFNSSRRNGKFSNRNNRKSNQNKGNNRNNKTNVKNNRNGKQNGQSNVVMQPMMQQQPMMMMPVVMGPNGQYMMAAGAQPMAMMQSGVPNNAPKPKLNNRKRKSKAKKEA